MILVRPAGAGSISPDLPESCPRGGLPGTPPHHAGPGPHLKEIAVDTARLSLRRLANNDLEDFLAYQAEVRRHLPGEPMSHVRAAEYLTAHAALDEQARDAWHALVVHHVADDRVIGDLGIWLPAEPGATPDIGFQFHPAYHGQGYAREAVRAFLDHVFGTLAPPRITATCDPGNTASQALMKRLGMRLSLATADKVEYDLTLAQWREMRASTGC